MNKLLREVPTMESWVSESATSSFVQVTLDQDFIDSKIRMLNAYIQQWLLEPLEFSNQIGMRTTQ